MVLWSERSYRRTKQKGKSLLAVPGSSCWLCTKSCPKTWELLRLWLPPPITAHLTDDVCHPCGCTGPHAVALWLCCHCYEILFLNKELHIFFHFALSPTNHAVGPASGPAGRAGLPFWGSWVEDYI